MDSSNDQTGSDGPDQGGASFYISPRDRDLMIRTVVGEAGNQPDVGKVAVASTILNRVVAGGYGGDTPTDVVLAPNQFEPWSTRKGQLLALSPDSPQYQRAAAAVDATLSGAVPDPTGGATHFYAPVAQSQLGRNAPAWATPQTRTAQIGGHVFYAPEGRVAPDALPANAAQTVPSRQPSAVAGKQPPANLSDDALSQMLLGTAPGGNAGSGGNGTGSGSGSGSGSAGNAPAAPPGGGPMMMTVHPNNPAPSPITAAPDASPNPANPNASASLSDADIEAMLLKGAAQAPAAPAGGNPAAPAPQTAPNQQAAPGGDATAAVGGGILEGVPIAGPYIRAGAVRVAAAARAYLPEALGGQPNSSYANELAKVQAWDQGLQQDHPTATTAGQVLGAGAAMAPVIAAAPAAFGLTGPSLLARIAAGAGTGGALGATDNASRQIYQMGGDPTGIDSGAVGMSALIGGGLGGGAPVAGQLVGGAVNKLVGRSGTAPAVENVNRLLGETGMTPHEAQAALSRMGPAATLADLDPAFTTEAGALAARGGKPTSILKNAMADRAANANDRVSQMMNDTLGPKPDLNAELDAFHARAQQAADPHYDAARSIGQPVDVNPIIDNIDQRLNTAVGGEADVLNKVRGLLLTKDGLPKIAPDAVLKVRQAIDDYAERLPQAQSSAGRNARSTLTDLRRQVDGVLKTNPDIANGDAAFAGEMKLRDAMQEGTELFTRKVRPEDFAKRVDTAQPGEVDALRAGARVAIGDALEQASRGELAGARQLLGSGSANRTKLLKLFPQAGDVLDAIQTEAAMRATEGRVAANSATAERVAAGARYQPPGAGSTTTNDRMSAASGMALGDPSGGVATALARRGAGGIMNKLTQGKYDRLATGTAEQLAASGAGRDRVIANLLLGQRGSAAGAGANAATNLLVNAGGGHGAAVAYRDEQVEGRRDRPAP